MSSKSEKSSQVVYVDRHIVEASKAPDAIIIEKEVIRHVEVPVYHDVVVEKSSDLSDITKSLGNHKEALQLLVDKLHEHNDNFNVLEQHSQKVAEELEMQRRALVALRSQRSVDRSRRLMLIHRLRKEKNSIKSLSFKLRLAVAASLLLSIVSLIVKL